MLERPTYQHDGAIRIVAIDMEFNTSCGGDLLDNIPYALRGTKLDCAFERPGVPIKIRWFQLIDDVGANIVEWPWPRRRLVEIGNSIMEDRRCGVTHVRC